MSTGQWWNDDYQGKLKNSEINLLQCHFTHHKGHLKSQGFNLGLRGENLAPSRLSYGTAYLTFK
jgi:hypothetical protein